METIDIGKDFCESLISRNSKQGDGKFTAVEFREKYLNELDNESIWKTKDPMICLDFTNVRTLMPSFANEAFAYFLRYKITPDDIKHVILFKGLSPVKELIINQELKDGYKKH